MHMTTTPTIAETIARFNALTDHTPDCAATTDPYAPDDRHDYASTIARHILSYIDDDTTPLDQLIADCYPEPEYALDALELNALLHRLYDDPYARDALSEIALNYSLCPMHFCDYAACFDDDDDECAAIRIIFPSHDT